MAGYWHHPLFQGKKPGRSRTPDNIHRRDKQGILVQVPNSTHVPADTGRDVRGVNALYLKQSWYFGEAVAVLPERFGLRMNGGRRMPLHRDIERRDMA
jgi:hypothetical protein